MSEIRTTCQECKSPLTIDPQSVDLSDVKCPVCDASVPIPSPIPVRHPEEHIHADSSAKGTPPQPSATVRHASKNERYIAVAGIVLLVVLVVIVSSRSTPIKQPQQPFTDANATAETVHPDSLTETEPHAVEPSVGPASEAEGNLRFPDDDGKENSQTPLPEPESSAATPPETASAEMPHRKPTDATMPDILDHFELIGRWERMERSKDLKTIVLLDQVNDASVWMEFGQIGNIPIEKIPQSEYLTVSEDGRQIDIFAVVRTVGGAFVRNEKLGSILSLRVKDGQLLLIRRHVDLNMVDHDEKIPQISGVRKLFAAGNEYSLRLSDRDAIMAKALAKAPTGTLSLDFEGKDCVAVYTMQKLEESFYDRGNVRFGIDGFRAPVREYNTLRFLPKPDEKTVGTLARAVDDYNTKVGSAKPVPGTNRRTPEGSSDTSEGKRIAGLLGIPYDVRFKSFLENAQNQGGRLSIRDINSAFDGIVGKRIGSLTIRREPIGRSNDKGR